MKKILFLSSIFLFNFSCSKNGSIKSYYDDGKLKTEEYWKNGMKDSVWISYYNNGQILNVDAYKNDTLIYYQNYYDNGKIRYDSRIPQLKWYKNGNLKQYQELLLGRSKEIINYESNGNILNHISSHDRGRIITISFYNKNGELSQLGSISGNMNKFSYSSKWSAHPYSKWIVFSKKNSINNHGNSFVRTGKDISKLPKSYSDDGMFLGGMFLHNDRLSMVLRSFRIPDKLKILNEIRYGDKIVLKETYRKQQYYESDFSEYEILDYFEFKGRKITKHWSKFNSNFSNLSYGDSLKFSFAKTFSYPLIDSEKGLVLTESTQH